MRDTRYAGERQGLPASRVSPLFFVALLALAPGWASQRPPAAAVASAHPLATAVGHEILAAGGNAFDAAVAVAAALAVVEPFGSGLGGGGFFLLHRASDGHEVMVDARERAPLAAHRDMFLDDQGDPIPSASLDGALAAAIPGTPAALVHIAEQYGHLPLRRSLAPAIRLARAGFPVTPRYQRMAEARLAALRASPEAARVFLDAGSVPREGFIVRQPELAATLERLAEHGHTGFYLGETAARLILAVRAAGGIWVPQDLALYRVVEREPVRGRYRGVRVSAAALPSSGGVVLIQMLNILEGLELDAMDRVERTHVLIEAMRAAYRDRAAHLGDPDYVQVDVAHLLSREYAARLRRDIVPRLPRSPQAPAPQSLRNTTHFSILDRAGNRVAATLSLNAPFGSGFVAPGTGVVLNNEMDDFVVKPGVPNLYGLVGSEANAIAPGKRPLSSMTPAFLETGDAVVILGTPGGSRIISMVLLATLDFAHGHGRPHDWVARPRFHHQYLPDEVQHESGAFSEAEARTLVSLGHRLREVAPYGNMQLILWDRQAGRVEAVSDPRGEGEARVLQDHLPQSRSGTEQMDGIDRISQD